MWAAIAAAKPSAPLTHCCFHGPHLLPQELCNAGRDALWRAAGGYQPNRHTRFSTYASAAILNGLRDVLRQQQSQLVHVPRQARGWAAQVRRRLQCCAAAQMLPSVSKTLQLPPPLWHQLVYSLAAACRCKQLPTACSSSKPSSSRQRSSLRRGWSSWPPPRSCNPLH